MAHLNVSVEGSVGIVEMNNPPFNCLTPEFISEFNKHLISFRTRSPRVRSVIFRSAVNDVFSHGVDPEYFVKSDLNDRKRVFITLGEMMRTSYELGIPIIADVSGSALAGGAVIALMADYVAISSQAGKICFSESKVGVPLPPMIQELIRHKVVPSATLDIILLAKNFDAKAAVQVGLANVVYDSAADRDKYVKDLCGRFERLAPEVVANTLVNSKKHLVNGLRDFRTSIDEEFAPFLGDKFLGKGLNALLKGEKLVW